MSEEKQDRRGAERFALKAEVVFYVDSDIIDAQSVDISETGIRLVADTPVVFRFRVKTKGKETAKSAELVWVRKQPDGTLAYGLKFLPDQEGYR